MKLAVAFAVATAAVLAMAGVFVYQQVSHELNDSIDETLASRTQALVDQLEESPGRPVDFGVKQDPEDSFSQVIRSDGTVVGSTSAALSESVLDPEQLAAVTGGEGGFDVGQLPGIDGDARLLARPAGGFAVVAGAATQDRDETLSGLVRTFLIAAPLALLIASALGYALATIAMRPVEQMRRRAGRITLERSGERLPLSASRDEIHRLGETLNDMLDRIEGSLSRERTFIADASHELRTPLAVAGSELELGLRPDRDLAAARAAMASSAEEIERLRGLTEDLLALASSGGQLSIEATVVPIPELLERVRSRFAARAESEDRRVAIGTAVPLTAELDSARIQRALGNLIENALRHGDGEVIVSSRTDDGMVVFEVRDQGAGFPDGFAETAFERFARAEAGRTTAGYGLGLAIVKAIAEAHGGTVSIDPDASGTAVIMSIPQNPAHSHG